MRKLILLFVVLYLVSCGKKDGQALGKEVCDCYTKTNSLIEADPRRYDAVQDCNNKKGEAYYKVKDDKEQTDKFLNTIGECGHDLLKDEK